MAGGAARWAFRGTFRSYQQRALEFVRAEKAALVGDVDALGDVCSGEDAQGLAAAQAVHIVAAPGSGKTILGLELAGQRGQPVLVLSPTLTIRDQWITRLTQNFDLAPEITVADFSTDMKSPRFFTSTTYQALFAAVSGGDGGTGTEHNDADVMLAHLVQLLERLGIGTVILDEAHHLRTEWHRVLTELLAQLRRANPRLCTIALTATPPYDASVAEWQKYIALCGEIDMEISVPELVSTGDLAPHQDFVYVGTASAEDSQKIARLTQKVTLALAQIEHNGKAREALVRSPIITNSPAVLDECFDDEQGLAGFMRILDSWQISRPNAIQALFDAAEIAGSISDGLKFAWQHPKVFDAQFTAALETSLRENSLLKGERFIAVTDKEIERILAASIGKLDAVTEVVTAEAQALGPRARILVLADHIRAEALRVVGTTEPLAHLGVIPAFETLRRTWVSDYPELASQHQIGVLTGSVVLASVTALPALQRHATVKNHHFAATPLDQCPEYVRLDFPEGSSAAVETFTAAFAAGDFSIIFGTAALLGEGWDMPQLNTLVLASSIKATMMANQMRGRAIRTDPSAPDKVANIWHITCAEPSEGQGFAEALVEDLLDEARTSDSFARSFGVRQLAQRFETFVGPHATLPRVENGIERCASKADYWEQHTSKRLNADNLERSAQRGRTRELWREAIAQAQLGSARGLNLQVAVENELRTKAVPMLTGVDYLIACAALILLVVGVSLARVMPRLLLTGWGVAVLAMLVSAVLLLAGLRWHTYRVVLAPKRRVTVAAQAILEVLRNMGLVRSAIANVQVVEQSIAGEFTVLLAGAKPREQEVFSTAIAEFFGPVKSPRYLLVPAKLYLLGGQFLAMSVPQAIGVRRDSVDQLVAALAVRGLKMQASYTRSDQGRSLLLQARERAAQNLAAGLTKTKKGLE